MENYVLKLLKDDGATLDLRSSAFSDLRAVWSEVASLAHRSDMTGGRIVVTNPSGEVVILVGAAIARSYPPTKQATKINAATADSTADAPLSPRKAAFADGA